MLTFCARVTTYSTQNFLFFTFSFASSSGRIYSSTKVDRCHRSRPYGSALRALATVVREEGPTGLYKGLVPAIFSCTQGGVQVVVYKPMHVGLELE